MIRDDLVYRPTELPLNWTQATESYKVGTKRNIEIIRYGWFAIQSIGAAGAY